MNGRNRTIFFVVLVMAAGIAGFLILRGDSPPFILDHGGQVDDGTRGGPADDPARTHRVSAEGPGGGRPYGHITSGSVMLREIEPLYDAYFDIQMALAGDDYGKAVESCRMLEKITGGIDRTVFKHPVHDFWMEISAEIIKYSVGGARSKDIAVARDSFYYLSKSVIVLQDRIGHSGGDFYLAFCPTARNNTGAYWIQEVDTVYNSFHGGTMVHSGSIEKKLPPAGYE